MRTPADVLASMLESDQGRPRVTFYDDTPGPTQGERIELSARVLVNWVNKAANALQDEYDIGPHASVRLDLPTHWRALYWALATWSVGGCVITGAAAGPPPTDLTVTDDQALAAPPAVLVTLPALARTSPRPVPPGAMDEARELASFGDLFEAYDAPGDDAPALHDEHGTTPYAAVVTEGGFPPGVRAHTDSPDLATVLRMALGVFAADGSLVISRGSTDPATLAHRLTSEGVTPAS